MKFQINRCVNTIEKVKQFADVNYNFRGKITVSSGRYVVDGKSIMGLFSLNLTDDLSILIEYEDDNDLEELLKKYKEFL